MQIIIKTKNLELTPAREKFIQEKIGGLSKFANFLQKSVMVFVEIENETKHHRKGPYFKAEVRILLPGKTLLAVSKRDDLSQAIVEVKDELQQEIKKYKAKTEELKIREQKQSKSS